MYIADMTIVGWFHTITIVAALVAGAVNLVAEKGTAQHKRVGLLYLWSMIVSNLSAFGIYRFDIASYRPFSAGPHVFGTFHWLAVSALVLVLLGRYAASRQDRAIWSYVHPISMISSYYIILGGLVNEAFARLSVLRAVAVRSAGTVTQRVNAPVIQMTHAFVMTATILVVVYFAAKVARYRRGTSTRGI